MLCAVHTDIMGNKLDFREQVLASELCKARQVKDEKAVKCLHSSDHIHGWIKDTVGIHPRGKETSTKEARHMLCFWLPWWQAPSPHVDGTVMNTTLENKTNDDNNTGVKGSLESPRAGRNYRALRVAAIRKHVIREEDTGWKINKDVGYQKERQMDRQADPNDGILHKSYVCHFSSRNMLQIRNPTLSLGDSTETSSPRDLAFQVVNVEASTLIVLLPLPRAQPHQDGVQWCGG